MFANVSLLDGIIMAVVAIGLFYIGWKFKIYVQPKKDKKDKE